MEDGYSQRAMRGRRLVRLFWAVTPKQRFVLYLVVRGWNAQEIAEHLGVKKRSVQIYMNQIKRKAEELGDNGKLEAEEKMDTGQGKFEMSDGSAESKEMLEGLFPNHGGWFRVDEIVELKGSRFRVKAVKPTELRLKLLPKLPTLPGK